MLSPVYIRGVTLAWSWRNCLFIQCWSVSNKSFFSWLLCTHWCLSSTFHSVIWLQSKSIIWNDVCLGGALKVAARRDSLKFSHQRTDGCEETAGVMQAHTHTSTHKGPHGSYALCQVGQKHNSHMRTHIRRSTNRPLRLTYIEPWLVQLGMSADWAEPRNARTDRHGGRKWVYSL